LDPAIDARAGDVPANEWTGFHPIEQALFAKKTTKGLDELADKLQTDVEDLQKRAQQLGENTRNEAAKDRYQPDEVANGAVALLGEVQSSKITGEEERYSHIDLLDFAANVEGSQQAFAALKPALNQIDPTLVPAIDAKFDALTKELDTYQDDSALGGYVLYVDLDKSDTKKLTDGLLAVIEPLSDVSAKIANA
jgi:iron uptake system component EfeO